MEFYSKYYGDTLLFKPRDVILDDLGTIRFKRELMMALQKGRIKNVIINMRTVKMLVSEGLGGILYARRYTHANGGETTLVLPQPKITNQLKLSKMTDSFRFVETEEDYKQLKEELEKSIAKPAPAEKKEAEPEEKPENGRNNGKNGREKPARRRRTSKKEKEKKEAAQLEFHGMDENAVPSEDDFSFEE